MEGFLESEEGVRDVSKVGSILFEGRFHRVGVDREGLSNGCQKGVNSVSGDHYFRRGVESTGKLVFEIPAEVVFGGFSV